MLLGQPRDFVAEKTGVSSGAVSNYWKRFKAEASRMGSSEAARGSGVEEELDALRRLAEELNKAQLTVNQSSAGVLVLNILEKLEIPSSELERFAIDFYKHASETRRSPKTLVSYAAKLLSLESQTGLDHQAIIREYDKRREELNRLTVQIQQLKAEEEDAKRKRAKALSDHDVTLETLNEYGQMRDSLTSHGVEVREVKRLATMMKSSKELGFDPSRIISYIGSIESLSTQHSTLKDRMNALEGEVSSLILKRVKLGAEITTLTQQKEALEASIKILKESGVKKIEETRDRAIENMEKLSRKGAVVLDQYKAELEEALANAEKKRVESSSRIESMIDEVEASIEEVRDRASETGRKIGKLEAIAPITNLLAGSGGQPHEVFASMSVICQQFKIWLQTNPQYSYSFFQLDGLISDLGRAIR